MAAVAAHGPAASSSSSTFPPRPSNLLTIFQAHFHTRRGNELTFQSGHDLDLAGVEWKVLPSGSHALSSDLLWFTLPDTAEGEGHGYDKVGVACFRNRKLTGSAEEEADAETEQSGGGTDANQQEARRLDERGARMTAVGVIIASQSSIPSHQLAAVLPHLEALSLLADASSLQPRNHSVLKNFLESHRFNTASSAACFPSLHVRSPAPLTRWPESIYDPLLDLPSIVNALGLILPDVLRSLLVSGTRLLLFSPQGVETRSAASIAWTLAEIVEAALTIADENEERDEEAALSPKLQRLHQHIPQVRGIIGLHEISHLQDEEARKKQAATMSGVRPKRGWIAWTTDKLTRCDRAVRLRRLS
ncbi:hypothetical protein BCV69DRAFT_207981 [Microstroma glucosiphilum]|uniref:Uncharacterized protein n=1 Tax=Pseudomicrostroma glucosiphilum TaxID=1684307 RepID=A0A316U7G0_9BASI|nr:hypothetical protein BCV69DRAFT_207981 [Pseudomicrostroma glucosiphilum]PWN20381.1 hypothetical protein BCV69DRAFT_207981 [Pseudomicrostroma glucosiphilum]